MKNIIYTAVVIFFMTTFSPAQVEKEIPRVIVDISEFDMKINKTELVSVVKVKGGDDIEPERRDTKLIEVQLIGKSPEDGFLTLYPNSFGLQYLLKNNNKLSMSKAWGIKYKDPGTAKLVELWNSNLSSSINLGVYKNKQFDIWFVCDIPKEVKEFYVLVPSLINTIIKTK